tara:strand:+ start:714 stop:884 length:171 start_codon:yes stop_codon:yes gene_type:complete
VKAAQGKLNPLLKDKGDVVLKTAFTDLISGTQSCLERHALECDSHVGLTEKILAVS